MQACKVQILEKRTKTKKINLRSLCSMFLNLKKRNLFSCWLWFESWKRGRERIQRRISFSFWHIYTFGNNFFLLLEAHNSRGTMNMSTLFKCWNWLMLCLVFLVFRFQSSYLEKTTWYSSILILHIMKKMLNWCVKFCFTQKDASFMPLMLWCWIKNCPRFTNCKENIKVSL